MKKIAVTLFFQIAAFSACAQSSSENVFENQVRDFVGGAYSCNLFLAINDAGLDGVPPEYSEKLTKILNTTQMTSKEAYEVVYQRCYQQSRAVAILD